ncbi:MAG: amino acid permease [Thaumarchaeota archaeon]|nr:amino acid permease [Nitrososphaerota archaeon]
MAELKRELGLFDVTMYGIGLILGAGIYVLIGKAAEAAGNMVWLSFIIVSVVATFTGLSYAELSSMYPKAAAEYVFIKKAFNSDFLAFVVGWLIVFTTTISASTISLGFGGYLSGLSGLPIPLTASLLIIALSLVNFYGIQESSRMNILFTLIEVSGLVIIIYLGFAFGTHNPEIYLENPFGFNGILAAIPLIFFAYIGFEHIANVAEETKDPRKVLPRAVMLSIAVTSALYMLVSLAAVSLIDWRALGLSLSPLADVAGSVLGSQGYLLLSVIALFATTNTVLISLIAGSRILYGMAEQHSLPPFLSKVHSKRRTPWLSIISVMIIAVALALIENIVIIAEITVFTIVITFTFVNLSLIRLRYKEPNAERPFKVPINVGKFPVLPFLGVITSIAGITQFDIYVVSVGLGVIGLAALFFLIYSRKHVPPKHE